MTDDAIPSPDTAGRSGGVGADVMGDMMGMMGAAVKGDDKRAARDVADMARQQNSGECATALLRRRLRVLQSGRFCCACGEWGNARRGEQCRASGSHAGFCA